MRVHAIGVVRLSGTSRNTGNNYDFAQLYYLRPIESRSGQNNSAEGAGQEQASLDISLLSFPKFKSIAFPRSGLLLDLTIDNVPARSGRGMDAQVIDFKIVEQQKAA